jgi:hypothetical protein
VSRLNFVLYGIPQFEPNLKGLQGSIGCLLPFMIIFAA